jgi:phosphoadenosine phosphosulfate reductase
MPDLDLKHPRLDLARATPVEVLSGAWNYFGGLGHAGLHRKHGELYRDDPDLCCYLNKVQPLERAQKEYSAWVSGIRRVQTSEPSAASLVEMQDNGRLKICPLVNGTERDVWRYIHSWCLPEHPLLETGYLSIDCAPCTCATSPGEDVRAGRWPGLGKTE